MRIRSRPRAEFTDFSHLLWISISVMWRFGFFRTLSFRMFQIVCQAVDTRMANNRPIAGIIFPFECLNLTRLQPKMSPQLRGGQLAYFMAQSSSVRCQINFAPEASHSIAMCSRLSGTPHVGQTAIASRLSICIQKSPTLKMLWIDFQDNSRWSRLRFVDV